MMKSIVIFEEFAMKNRIVIEKAKTIELKKFEQNFIKFEMQKLTYSDWKKDVKNELEQYPDEQIVNLIKAIELKEKKLKNENDNKNTDYIAFIVSVVGVIISCIFSMYTVLVDRLMNIAEKTSEKLEWEEYLKFMEDRMWDLSNSGFSIINQYIKYVIIFFLIAFIAKNVISAIRIHKEIFYKEILEILNEIKSKTTGSDFDYKKI